MFDKTITLFNHYHSRNGDMWFPHVIKDVQLVSDKASIIAKYGAQSTDSATLIIPLTDDETIGGLPYIKPKMWSKLTNSELQNYITVNDGMYFDFFIVGEYPEFENLVNDDDYSDGFYNYMNSQYDDVFAITSVGKYSLIPHLEILAK